MGSKSDYLEAKLLDLVLGANAFSAPVTTYIALFTANPTDASASGTEVTGGSYVRLAVANNTTNWPNATGTSPSTKSNGTVFTFATPSADWGLVTGFAIYDAPSGGNELYWGALTVSKQIYNGDPVSFPIGSLVVTED